MRLATIFAFSAAAVSALTSGGKEATKRLQGRRRALNPVYSETTTKFMNKVKGRKLDLPLRWALVRIGKMLHAKILRGRASTAHSVSCPRPQSTNPGTIPAAPDLHRSRRR